MTGAEHRKSVPEKKFDQLKISTTQISEEVDSVNDQTINKNLIKPIYTLANKMGKAYQMQLNCNLTPVISTNDASRFFDNYVLQDQKHIVMDEHSKGAQKMGSWKCSKNEVIQTTLALLENINDHVNVNQPILTDPLEGYNRWMFDINEVIYEKALNPLTKGYRNTVHQNLRIGIKNLISNAMSPVKLINSLLQLDFEKSGRVIARTLINTTFGIGGLADVAGEEYHIDQVDDDFDKALDMWGMPSGTYVVLPFIGSSTTRNAVGRATNILISPAFIFSSPSTSIGVSLHDSVNKASFNLGEKKPLEANSPDKYYSTHILYRQKRILVSLGISKAKEKINLLAGKIDKPNPRKLSRKERFKLTTPFHSGLQKIKTEKPKLIEDIYQVNSKQNKSKLININKNFNKITTSNNEILKYLEKWLNAWEKQDIKSYLSFYAKDFRGLKDKHTDWVFFRQHALKRNTNISVLINNITIIEYKDTVRINFTQNYNSDSYSDIGTKDIVWFKNGNKWEIISEIWKPKIISLNISDNTHPKTSKIIIPRISPHS
jgi:phospholipid-binding lipoprotein MlaA